MCGIYKIVNLINGKVYIGQSISIERRWAEHRTSKGNYYIDKAIKKYGINNFEFCVIEECLPERLNELETKYINEYKSLSTESGYNISRGGKGNFRTTDKLYNNVTEIISLLKGTTSMANIAKKFDTTVSNISQINNGTRWFQKNISYPIRHTKTKKKQVKYCANCTTKIQSNNRYCKKHYIQKSKIKGYDELYSAMHSVNFNKHKAKDILGVSYNTVKKWCARYNIVGPHNGEVAEAVITARS